MCDPFDILAKCGIGLCICSRKGVLELRPGFHCAHNDFNNRIDLIFVQIPHALGKVIEARAITYPPQPLISAQRHRERAHACPLCICDQGLSTSIGS